MSVIYTVGGTATNGADYQSLSGTVNIATGQTSAMITVTPIDDTAVEGNETVVLTVNASGSYTLGNPSSTTVTIADNDVPPGPSITASPSTVSPNGNVTASWAGVTSPTSRDWIGLYAAGAGDGSYQNWLYVSCTRAPGGAFTSGSCSLTVPSGTGNYELRLFANDGFGRIATSNAFAVSSGIQAAMAGDR